MGSEGREMNGRVKKWCGGSEKGRVFEEWLHRRDRKECRALVHM